MRTNVRRRRINFATGGLRSAAAESVIELVDALGMWAGKADEDHAARVFCDPVHHAEHNPLPLPPGVKIITLRLPWFERLRCIDAVVSATAI
jgi:hypothetical protein